MAHREDRARAAVVPLDGLDQIPLMVWEAHPVRSMAHRPGWGARIGHLALTLLVGAGLGQGLLLCLEARRVPEQKPPITVALRFGDGLPWEDPAPAPSGGGDGRGPVEPEQVPLGAAPLLQDVMPEAIPDHLPTRPIEAPVLDLKPLETPHLAASGGWGSGHGSGVGGGSGGTGRGSGHGAGLGGLGDGAADGLRVVDYRDLTVLHQEYPRYPDQAAFERISGRVLVKVVIDERGIPCEASVVECDHPLFEKEALRTARHWRFTPVILEGQAVRAAFTIFFYFTAQAS